jgi:hypothetical protein
METLGQQWMAAMRRGDDAAAWRIADQVLAARDPATRDDPSQPYHRRWVWDGRPLRGRHVLVRCYHGLGDTLQFVRFLPALRSRVASLTLEVQPALLPLLHGPDRRTPFVLDAPSPPAECDIEIMELSHALRLPPAALPPPYLHAAPAVIEAGAIGLCWQSGGWNAARSIPPALLTPLLAGRPAYSLQPAPCTLSVRNPGGCPPQIEATAALIAALGLVITVDTMVAHLAGALGRPVWLLLPHQADWRWGAGVHTPWYPGMRLYRQPAPGDWNSVIARITADLMARG